MSDWRDDPAFVEAMTDEHGDHVVDLALNCDDNMSKGIMEEHYWTWLASRAQALGGVMKVELDFELVISTHFQLSAVQWKVLEELAAGDDATCGDTRTFNRLHALGLISDKYVPLPEDLTRLGHLAVTCYQQGRRNG